MSLRWLENQLEFTSEHKEKVLARLEGDCFPIIGRKPADEVTREDIQKIANVITGRKAYDTARRVIAGLWPRSGAITSNSSKLVSPISQD